MNNSGFWVKSALLTAFAAASGKTGAQDIDSLSFYLASHPWDMAKSGPMIVVNPDHTRAKSAAVTLEAFGRKRFAVGTISAIAPSEMVLVDESLAEQPNMYDGLPRSAKALYLMTTLSDEQMKLATGSGIGTSDLHGEQIKVFKSLVGPNLTWETYTVNKDGILDQRVSQDTVPSDQMDQVKLRFLSGLMFHLTPVSNPNAYSVASPDSIRGKQGDKALYQRDSGDNGGFGTNPRKAVPNESKASQLNYRDPVLDKQVSFPADGTIKELLQRVGSAVGIEILSDIRVSGLPVKAFGSKARAGDLLKAIALCVTGTYRKVDSAYVLTSELSGMGARKLKFAAWKVNVDRELDRRQSEWRGQVVKSGAINRISFSPNDPSTPNDRMRTSMDKNEFVPTSALTPAMRDFVAQEANRDPKNPFNSDRVGIESLIEYALVLPNGQSLPADRIGQRFIFTMPSAPKPAEEINVERYPAEGVSRQYLVARAESAIEAKQVVEQAAAHGFKRVWLETHQSAALAAAFKAGLAVSLVIRPWEAPLGATSPGQDFDILGDTGSQLGARRADEPDWQACQKIGDGSGLGPPPLYDLAPPTDPALQSRWSNLDALAHTPGLAGVVVADSRPPGYEPTDNRISWGPSYQIWLAALHEFGYSPMVRQAFLKEHGVDPIDIATPDIDLDFDISQPFFIDGGLGHNDYSSGSPSLLMQSIPDEWSVYRAEMNTKAFEKFTNGLKGIRAPIWVMPRSSTIHIVPNLCRDVVPWTPGQPYPEFSPGKMQATQGGIGLFTFNEDTSLTAIRNLGSFLTYTKYTRAIDASSVKPEKLAPLLDRWFPKVESQK